MWKNQMFPQRNGKRMNRKWEKNEKNGKRTNKHDKKNGEEKQKKNGTKYHKKFKSIM